MTKDKKTEGGKVHFVLIKEIGDVRVVSMGVDEAVKLMNR
jgi:3-dehydroquinate synthetase